MEIRRQFVCIAARAEAIATPRPSFLRQRLCRAQRIEWLPPTRIDP